MDESEDAGKLMNTLKFGCQAVFGQDTTKNALPTDEDIALITDRTRTEDFSEGKLKGGADEEAEGFDATKAFTGTMEFGGIDFAKIREEHGKKGLETLTSICESWKKRQRKQRITMVASNGSGYGSMVPVLAANNYDLETGERSVFQQELKGKAQQEPKKRKKKEVFVNQDFCQSCGDGGLIVLCPRCPVSLHLKCAGMKHENHFAHCSHHRRGVCNKSGSLVGGFLFPCSVCPSALCEDHLPAGARFLENCERFEDLGYTLNHGVYVHCSKNCEQYAIDEFGYKIPGVHVKEPCPLPLDMASHFGNVVDDSLDAPDDVLILTPGKKRRLAKVNCASPKKPRSTSKSIKSNVSKEEEEAYIVLGTWD
jgi:hypothetical protein